MGKWFLAGNSATIGRILMIFSADPYEISGEMVKKNCPLARLRLQKRRHRHTIQTKSERTQGYELLHIWEMYNSSLLLAFLILPSEYEHGYIL